MLFLAFLVGVEEAHVPFASAPEDVVLGAEFDAGVDGVLDLHDGACDDVEVGVGGSAVHVAFVAEDVGCGPQQPDACLLHLLLEVVGDLVEVGLVFLDAVAFADEVDIVEAEVGDAQLLHEFESGVGFVLGYLEDVGAFIPREGLGDASELVVAFSAEGVPPCHGESQPVFHGFAHDHFFGVIVMEGHRVLGILAFELDLANSGEILFHRVG